MKKVLIVFILTAISAVAQVPKTVFSANFNKLSSPWCPVDGNSTPASIYGYRIWNTNNLQWADIEASNGSFVWTNLDTAINTKALSGGCPGTPMDVIYTFGGTPQWASNCSACADPSTSLPGPVGSGFGGGAQCSGKDDYRCLQPGDVNSNGIGTDANFAGFVSAIAARYIGGIKYYEIRNEGDSTNFWCVNGAPVVCGGGNSNTTPNTQALSILVRMGWDIKQIIHCIDPAAKIISPSFHGQTALTWFHNYNVTSISAPAGVSGVNGVPIGCNWSGQTVTGKQTYDYVNVHGYGVFNDLFPVADGNWSPEVLLSVYTNTVTEIANDSLPNPTVIFNDEFGYNSTVSQSGGATNDDIRISYIARSYSICASVGFFRCDWFEWDTTTFGPSQANPGIAFDQVASWLIGATSTSVCAVVSSIYTCGFTSPLGVPELVVWDVSQNCDTGCTTANHSFGSAYSQYTDLTGVTSPTTGGNGTVPLGLKPLLVQSRVAPPHGLTVLSIGQ